MGGVGAAAFAGTGTARESMERDASNAGRSSVQGQPADGEFTAQISITNPDVNFNEFNFANYSWTLTDHLMDPLAIYNGRTDEWRPVLAEDWTLGDGSLEMTLRDGYHWHGTGEPLTAQDAARSFWLEIRMDWSITEYATDVRAADDRTVVFDLRESLNRSVLEHELLGGTWVNKPPHVYGDWIQRFEQAEDEEETASVREELAGWTLNEPFGYGPFSVTNMNEQRMEMEPFDGHPASDAINFDSYAFEYIGGGNNTVWQAMRANTVDAVPSVFAPQQIVDGLPDNWQMTVHPSYDGYGVAFDHEHPDLGNRQVRRAIAHAIDREQVAGNVGENVMSPVEVVDGLAPDVSDQWFGDWTSNLDAYEYDSERATELMREAGYQKQGQFWRGPGGRLQLTFVAPAGWSDWVTAAQTINSQLKGFGINTRLNTIEAGTYNSQTLSSGQWDLASYGWGGGPYPLFSYQQLWEEEDYQNLNYPREVEVPAMEGSGTTTVALPDLLERIRLDGSNDEQGFRQLAWVWNQDLPMLQVGAGNTQSFITTDDWDVPAADADVMAYSPPAIFLPKFGELQAKTG